MATGIGGEVLWLLPATGITDQSTAGNDGAYSGGMGVAGGVFVFDGTNDYISVPEFQSDQALDFSASVWFSVDNTARIKNVILANDLYSSGIMFMSWAGVLYFYIKHGSNNISYTIPGYANSTLYHAVITKEYAASYSKLYINGVAVTVVNGLSSGTINPTSAQPFLIGTGSGSYGYLDGTESDFRYFNRAITAGEVTTLYNGGVPGYDAAPAPDMSVLGTAPVAAWCPSLDTAGNGTTTLTDLSGSGNNGTLTNMDAATDWVADTGAGGVRALDFDGANDYVSFAATTANTSHTVSVWVYNRDAGDAIVVGGGPNVYAMYISGNAAGQSIYYAAAASVYVSVLHGGMANAWTHLAVRRSGTNVQFYKNGVQIGTDQTLTSNPTTSFRYLGREGGGFYLNGLIDDIRIFTTALTAPGIAYLYNSGSGRGVQPASGNPTGILQNNIQSIRLGL